MNAVSTEVKDGVLIATITRPEAGNSVNKSVLDGLGEVTAVARSNEAIQGIVITGYGERFFSTGGDLEYLAGLDVQETADITREARSRLAALEETPVVTCAALNGAAVGGGLEIALACDFRLARKGVTLAMPQIHLGLIPGWEGVRRLVDLSGYHQARSLVLRGATLNTEDAAALGLIDEVVEGSPRDLAARARKRIREWGGQYPREVIARLKEELLETRGPVTPDPQRSMERFLTLWDSNTHREAERSFLARRGVKQH